MMDISPKFKLQFIDIFVLANFKGNTIVILSTRNTTRIVKNLLNSSIKNIASKILGHDLFVYFFTYTTNEKKRKEKRL